MCTAAGEGSLTCSEYYSTAREGSLVASLAVHGRQKVAAGGFLAAARVTEGDLNIDCGSVDSGFLYAASIKSCVI